MLISIDHTRVEIHPADIHLDLSREFVHLLIVFAQFKSGLFCAPCVGVDVCEGTGTGVGVTWLVSALMQESSGQPFKLSLGHVVSHLDLLCVKYDLNYRVISFSSGYEGMVLLFCLREFGRESYLVY